MYMRYQPEHNIILFGRVVIFVGNIHRPQRDTRHGSAVKCQRSTLYQVYNIIHTIDIYGTTILSLLLMLYYLELHRCGDNYFTTYRELKVDNGGGTPEPGFR